MMRTVIVGTWPFSMVAVQKAADVINLSKNTDQDLSLIAVETGINEIECDANYGEYFVGRGGIRNQCGELELDAGIMSGKNLQYGAVISLQGISNPISVARKVMEVSHHSILSGNGAQTFATKQGFLLDEEILKRHETHKAELSGHDTLGLICSFKDDITVGVSTSGMGGKEAGRVGDSALPGSGLYADCEGGAACCSGDGDEILKHCPAYRVVHYMKQGLVAQDACDKVINEIQKRSVKSIELVIIAVDSQGNVGAGSTLTEWTDPKKKVQMPGFPYIVWEDGMVAPEMRLKKINS